MNVSTLRWIHKVLFVYKYMPMHVCGPTFTLQLILIQNMGQKSFPRRASPLEEVFFGLFVIADDLKKDLLKMSKVIA